MTVLRLAKPTVLKRRADYQLMWVMGTSTATVAKFDRDDKDTFELWSKDRAKELAKLNAALLNRQMNRSLISYSRRRLGQTVSVCGFKTRSVTDSAFLPYNYNYNSPYGYGYNSSVYQYAVNSYVNNQNGII